MNFIKETYRKFTTGVENHFKKSNLIIKFIIGIDFLFSYIIYGASVSDYFQYMFYKKRHMEKKTFVTCRKYKKLYKKYNNPEDSNKLKDKALFNSLYGDYIKREWLDIKECTLEEFKKFCENKKHFIIKPRAEGQGRGIEKIDLYHIQDLKELFEKLKEKEVILEEMIAQDGSVAEFNPSTVNTIRVNIFKSDKKINIINAAIRFGKGEQIVTDNLSTGGITANIDIETGIIYTLGVDKLLNTYICHPTSQKQIIGFTIPYWAKVKEYVIELSEKTPNVRYIGWDIVIKKEGELLTIEGNDRANPDIQQISSQKGLWPKYKKVIKEIKKK